ncbi:MAG: inorganic phosphate transporter [Bacillota bacterium]
MGVNDGAIAIATTVATRAVKPRTALIVGAITKFITPIAVLYLGNAAVASNISENLIFSDAFADVSTKQAFAFMFSGLLGAMIWAAVAYRMKLPNSISHTLLGGIIGAAIAAFGFSAVKWTDYVLVNIVLMVFLAPTIGLVLGFIIMRLLHKMAKRAPRKLNKLMIAIERFNLVVLSAGFASNNSQKSLGIFMMMFALGLSSYSVPPLWVTICFALALTFGLLFGGTSVVNTVGRKIFKLQDEHAVAAQFTTSLVMVVATECGIAVSTGQVLSSSIMGVGASERFRRVNWNTSFRIVRSWLITLPVSGLVSALLYLIIGKLIMGI